MVNNFTNINKANNHFSPSLTELKEKTIAYDFGNPGPASGQAQQCGGIKSLIGSQPSLLDNWISIGNISINKR